jgi:hypothetical protein
MKCSRDDFFWAARQEIITVEQAKALWDALDKRVDSAGASRFNVVNVLYYVGTIIVLLAMSWFFVQNWTTLGTTGALITAATYFVLFAVGGARLWNTPDLKTPGGLLSTIAVSIVPLIAYLCIDSAGFWKVEEMHNFWWTVVHGSTLAASLIALYFVRFPFLTAPLSYSLWALATTSPFYFAPLVDSFNARCDATIFYGLCMLLTAYGIDQQSSRHRDFGFWMYLFGTLSLFGGMECMSGKSELVEFMCFLVYAAMMPLSVKLQRKVLVIFGGLGVIGYMHHVGWNLFHDSPLYPLVLVVCGLSTITAGVIVQRKFFQANRAQTT